MGGLEFLADARVPPLAGLDLAVVEGVVRLAAVAQPADVVEHGVAPGVVLVGVGEEGADRPGGGAYGVAPGGGSNGWASFKQAGSASVARGDQVARRCVA